MEILQPYFPGSAQTPNVYTHGGSLYALGLIHQGHKNQEAIDYILNIIRNPGYNSNDMIMHGACLGLGLIGFASSDLTLYEELKNILFTDNAVTGEAAAVSIGCLLAGSANNDVIQELLTYAHETQHEKIIRSISIAMACIMLGREETADTLIEQLSLDKDPILRFGAMYMIGLAYVATGNNKALRKLLHYAVSDVSDDVRKAAVISIAFLLLKDPEQVEYSSERLSIYFVLFPNLVGSKDYQSSQLEFQPPREIRISNGFGYLLRWNQSS
jgi:26S proteasome regulatory subunit N2